MKFREIVFAALFLICIMSCSCGGGDSADQAMKKYKSIFDAVQAGDNIAVKGFLKKNPALAGTCLETDEKKYTPLAVAIVKVADAEKNPEKKDEAKKYIDVVKVFIDMDAGITVPVKNDDTPITIAAAQGQKEVVEMLLQKGAPIEAKGTTGWTPLHSAVLNNHKDLTEFLLKKGANINNKDANGCTPLHTAAGWGFKDIAELLIQNGAEINSVDNFKKTPLDYAVAKNNKDLIKLLKDKGGREMTSGAPVPKPLTTKNRQ